MDRLSTNNKHYLQKCKTNKEHHSADALYHVHMGSFDLIYPPTCAGCGCLGPQICTKCAKDMKEVTGNQCLTCGNNNADISKPCVHCVGRRDDLSVMSFWQYESVVARAVWEFKYKKNKEVLLELCFRTPTKRAAEMLRYRAENNTSALVPIPLHPKREHERGYNQSLIFAHSLGELLGIPVVCGAVARTKETTPQAQCRSRQQRLNNIYGAFSVVKPHLLAGKTILLVDDVVTTGLTVREVVRELKKHRLTWGHTICLAREEENTK